MKDYSNFTAIELAQDEDFIQWVEVGAIDKERDDRWNAWLVQHADKTEIVAEAKTIIKAVVNDKQYFLHDARHQELWSRIEQSTKPAPAIKKLNATLWYAIAASVVILIVAGIALMNTQTLPVAWQADTAQHAIEKDQLMKYTNAGSKAYTLVLADGSKVTLQPHSEISYPESFTNAKRDVYLSGEAFFEVTRDTQKPFSVYANGIVTRVLGTSFTIRAFDQEPDIVVAVKTGKVSVFKETEENTAANASQNLVGTLLTPNQQIVFTKDQSRMLKSLVQEPAALPTADVKEHFVFSDTPVKEVFSRMERNYGVEIIFDEEVMANCLLTTSLEGVPFYDKVRLICKGIHARYELLDGHVIITGNGCQ